MVKWYRKIHRCLWAPLFLTRILRGQIPQHLKSNCLFLLALSPKALTRAASTRLHVCRKPFPLVLCPYFLAGYPACLCPTCTHFPVTLMGKMNYPCFKPQSPTVPLPPRPQLRFQTAMPNLAERATPLPRVRSCGQRLVGTQDLPCPVRGGPGQDIKAVLNTEERVLRRWPWVLERACSAH